MKTIKALGYTLAFTTVLSMSLLPLALAGNYTGVAGADSELFALYWFNKSFAMGNEYKVQWSLGVKILDNHATSFRGSSRFEWNTENHQIYATEIEGNLAYYGRAWGELHKTATGGGLWDCESRVYSVSDGWYEASNTGDYPSGSLFLWHGIESW